MQFIRSLLIGITATLLASSGVALAQSNDAAGYTTLSQPQRTDSGDKVEVIEFFGYFCPHCNVFDPALTDWVKKQKDNIVFKRVHVAFGAAGGTQLKATTAQQKMYYALEAMGKTEELHPKVFNAIHVQRQQLYSDDAITQFIVKQGIDKQKYTDVANSFGVQSKMSAASKMLANYNIDGVPTIVIDGRYVTSPEIAGRTLKNRTEQADGIAALKVMDGLVAKIKAERTKGGAKPATQK
jgi:protein dithiol oxidoreductase (disulfide-forming)